LRPMGRKVIWVRLKIWPLSLPVSCRLLRFSLAFELIDAVRPLSLSSNLKIAARGSEENANYCIWASSSCPRDMMQDCLLETKTQRR
jgi:hypothetical protein